MNKSETNSECPICSKLFPADAIETHVNRCIFLNTRTDNSDGAAKEPKRTFGVFQSNSPTGGGKKPKLDVNVNGTKKRSILSGKASSAAEKLSAIEIKDDVDDAKRTQSTSTLERKEKTMKNVDINSSIPLAEKMRPDTIDDYVGQDHIIGKNTILRQVLDKNEVPSMILWGPPGCGKTTLAHIIANQCKATSNSRFVKLSATMCGVNDVKEVIKVAVNERKFKRKTILFMDEIHRFNKLQQDTFLPHVESGAITLIGATTENPSFSLNSALLSRCRVIILEKIESDCMYQILCRSLKTFNAVIREGDEPPKIADIGFVPEAVVEAASIKWLADMCDGDARIALNSLQLALQSILDQKHGDTNYDLKVVTLDAIKDGIKKSHILYDRKGDQHYDMISALHKSIRASDDNAALYWCTRMMIGGEDPRYICRRLVRAASEDIGLADPQAVSIALNSLNAVQLVGMPEADVIIAQCAIYLARAPKSTEAYKGLTRCKRDINECQGPLPPVPLHLRNAPTKLMKEMGCAQGYNLLHKDISGLTYMPEGLEDRNYF
ncbi:ATPase WRNIP1-like [Bradysia coprophila]|uniref:ATPase WRNIP1-like n=2 Tax=Bradysia coprophila TaxID=38358 RepID=UPI00187D6FE8|nr:ATPase WRNIP1-like [Bradysia coprophila]